MNVLETKKAELENQLEELNQEIATSKKLQEVSELHRVSDILNDLHQNEVLEKYDHDLSGRLFTAMEEVENIIQNIIDK